MQKELINEINLYLENEIDLWDLVGEITYYSTVDFNSIKEIVTYLENNESDEALIVETLLWALPNSPIRSLTNTTNSFYKFLIDLKKSDDEFYNEEIVWVLTENHKIIFKKNNLLFIFNDENYDCEIELPNEYCNTTLHCLNCNEEINVLNSLNVPAKTFYIIEK